MQTFLPLSDQALDNKQELNEKRIWCAGMGEIAEVGEGVVGWEAGQRVTAAPWTYFEQVTGIGVAQHQDA